MYSDFANKIKSTHNNLIYKYTKQNRILILDGPLMSTTKDLIASGFDGQITVVEQNLATHIKHIKLASKWYNVEVKHAEIHHYLNTVDNTFYAAYFDFTCTPRGSLRDRIFPMRTINLFLKDKTADITLALTFSSRLRVKHNKGYTIEKEVLNMYLRPCFSKRKYTVEEQYFNKYRRTVNSQTMLFWIFRLKHDPNCNPVPILWEGGRKVGYG
jgi:hypothetical protein